MVTLSQIAFSTFSRSLDFRPQISLVNVFVWGRPPSLPLHLQPTDSSCESRADCRGKINFRVSGERKSSRVDVNVVSG